MQEKMVIEKLCKVIVDLLDGETILDIKNSTGLDIERCEEIKEVFYDSLGLLDSTVYYSDFLTKLK